ncbi:hypothetical protein M3D75_06540 [Microbacterium enclense]|nr:hypothetical protein [Microbacterium enclense]MCT2085767.1 hypothetical protein [Microbacterium enclense]
MIYPRRNLEAQRAFSDAVSVQPQELERRLSRREKTGIVAMQVEVSGPVRMLQSACVRDAHRPGGRQGDEYFSVAIVPPVETEELAQLIETRRIDQHVDIADRTRGSKPLECKRLPFDTENADA